MADRYFVEAPITAERAVLTGSEAHHLGHVIRAKVGAEVVLFDGLGAEFLARVERLGKSEVELRVLARYEVSRELSRKVTLAVALPKGERQRWLVEKAVELGVSQLLPLQTERGIVQPSENTLERLRRGVIEASKQCGRNKLMEVSTPASWTDFASIATGECRVLAHLASDANSVSVAALYTRLESAPSIVFAVGPEGGFTNHEVAVGIETNWQLVRLGPRILRVETAAVLLAALASST